MITGTVDSSKLSPKTLRAGDYLINPQREAEELVEHWVKCYQLQGLFSLKGRQMKTLKEMIAGCVRTSYELGQANQRGA